MPSGAPLKIQFQADIFFILKKYNQKIEVEV